MKNNFVITNQIVDKKHTKLNKTYNDRIKYKFYKIDQLVRFLNPTKD